MIENFKWTENTEMSDSDAATSVIVAVHAIVWPLDDVQKIILEFERR